jgi:flagellar biosynthetic protein FliP
MQRATQAFKLILSAILSLLFFTSVAIAQEPAPAPNPNPTGIDLIGTARNLTAPDQVSSTMMVVILVTVLTLAPALLVMTTSFTRIIVVLGILRQAMATQQSPPNQVLVGLALFLTAYIMWPTYQQVYDDAVQPYVAGELTQQEALDKGLKPVRDFMFRQANARDIALFIHIARLERPRTREDVPLRVLMPAFVLSELSIAFQIGFLVYIPFLIIDMVVASTLMSMGMMMLPPVFISLPFKIILFVLADGWFLLVGSLVRSFQ